jgi:flagellar hook assembly protein FlgD
VLQQVDPDVTAPVSGANVSGAVGVTAQVSDGAPLATLWVDGQPQGDPVAVSGGAVTLTWLSAGVANGAHQVGVAACGSAGHCAAPSQVPVTVANAAPVLVAPAANALVSGSTTLSATGPAGGKLFRRNGVDIGFDATAPYAVVANFSAVADADYSLTVQSCGAVRTTCGGLVSAPRTVRTRSLHPTVAVAPAQFSPNGDGRLDTTVVRYALDVPSGVVWTVTDGAGRVVRGPSSLGQRAAGSYAFVWNGRGNGNVALASGLYTLTLRTGRVVTGITLQGSARAGLRLDTVAPTMVVTPQAGGVYPYVDGFRDHLRARVVLNEPATLTLVVRNAAGAVVRVISAPRNAGATYLSWGGTDSLGRAVPGGTYRYAYIAQDALGNRRGTAFFSTGLSRARLVKTVQSRVVTAQASVTGSLVGSCSQVYKSDDYPTQGYDLLSRYDDDSCAYDGSSEDVAATKHAFTLPAAVSYGPIRVAVTGGETLPGYGYDDTAVALYADRNGEPTDIGALLPAAAGTTALPNVTSAYLSGGRTLRWYVVTGDGQWWTPRTFTVTWVAYVLKA